MKPDHTILADIFPLNKRPKTKYTNSRFYKLKGRANKVDLILVKTKDRTHPYEVTKINADGFLSGVTALERTLNDVLYRHIKPEEGK